MIAVNKDLMGLWFIRGPGSDWLAGLSRTAEGAFQLAYRFRYFATGEGREGAERERVRWFQTHVDCAPVVAIECVRRLAVALDFAYSATLLEDGAVSALVEVLRAESTLRDYLARILQQPGIDITSLRIPSTDAV